ncbi:hypothetical protein TNIN_252281 [Trichonephila inaurata madagascariensis]|uniref:Uncharacterized protein n=1 Tax=Trichonephila inaurata madagascariensis TaxID=2747483 RepID=A0A8X6XLE5_9ARAC|nr:hypothetical protein TNIN_252281 [Trichonephila inaurata madagascariensis]
MVYARISIDGSPNLHIIQNGALACHRYRDEIVRPIVVSYVAAIGDVLGIWHKVPLYILARMKVTIDKNSIRLYFQNANKSLNYSSFTTFSRTSACTTAISYFQNTSSSVKNSRTFSTEYQREHSIILETDQLQFQITSRRIDIFVKLSAQSVINISTSRRRAISSLRFHLNWSALKGTNYVCQLHGTSDKGNGKRNILGFRPFRKRPDFADLGILVGVSFNLASAAI